LLPTGTVASGSDGSTIERSIAWPELFRRTVIAPLIVRAVQPTKRSLAIRKTA
jgi:hypothetical protein